MKPKQYFLIDHTGRQIPPDQWDSCDDIIASQALTALTHQVMHGSSEPFLANHLQRLRQLQWLDYEPASDKGHFRILPRGALLYGLISDWLHDMCVNAFEAYEIITPMIYRWDDAALRAQAGIFANQIYPVRTPDEQQQLVLRFNGDIGAFHAMHDAQLTYRHLPSRIFEQTRGFRYTLPAQLAGIKRARSFTVIDMHSFCADVAQGFKEYEALFAIEHALCGELGFETAIHMKVPITFWESAAPTIQAMANHSGRLMLIELLPQQPQYWIMKHICHTQHPFKVFHLQLDYEDGPRYDLSYIDQEGIRKHCVIVHNSLASIERWMLIALHEAVSQTVPKLPLWLSPVQVRIVPISSEKHMAYCVSIAEQLTALHIRVDVDDRSRTMGSKIRDASLEWIPYVIICGDAEMANGSLSLRTRDGVSDTIDIASLATQIHSITAHKPYRPLPERLVSKTLKFRNT